MDSTDNLSRLMATKEEKIAALNPIESTQENFSNSTFDTGDGYVEHNGNKLWDISTNWTKGQNSFARDYIVENFSLPNSSRQDRRLYEFGVKDEALVSDPSAEFRVENYDPTKVGLSSGRFDSSDRRYLKWPAGTRGVDLNKKRSDINLDYVAGTALEALTHSSNIALENRLVRRRNDGYYDYLTPNGMTVISKEQKDEMFGSGATEYYGSHSSIYDDAEELTDAQRQEVISGINKAMELTAERFSRKLPTRTETPNDTTGSAHVVEEFRGNPIINTLAGFGATFVNELIVKPADAVGDLTGLYDLGNEEELTRGVNESFGYNPKAAEEAMHNIGNYWDVVSNSETSVADRARAAGNGILEAFTTPEMLGTSLGALISWVAPGALLKGVGIGSKFSKAAKELDAAVEAGEMTKSAARLQKAKDFMSIDGAKSFVTSQSGFITSSMGNVNAQYDQFVANNNGVELTGEDKAKWFAGRFAVQMFNQNLDKIVDFNIIKSPGLFAAAVPAVKAMTKKEFGNVVATMSKGMARTTLNAGSEAAQEYSQTMMELYNSRFGSEQFKDLDTFMKFLGDAEHTREGGIAALAGAGGSGQFELVGSVNPLIRGLTGTVANTQTISNIDAPTTPPTLDEVQTAKRNYGELLARTENYIREQGVSENNIGMVLDDLDELNSTKHIISTSSPELQAQGEAQYNRIVEELKTFVRANPDLKLKRRVVTKTVAQSKKDNDAKDLAENIPDEAKAAFQSLAKVIGNGEDKEFDKAYKQVTNKFKKSSFSDLVVEEGVIDKELQDLELALTGKVSEDLEETFDILKDRLSSTDPVSKSSATKPLKEQFKGKVILANAGIGKSFAVKSNPDLVDGDDLFTAAANKVVRKYNKENNETVEEIPTVKTMRNIFEAWGEYDTDNPERVAEAQKRREEVYKEYAKEARKLADSGKTVLSSSVRDPLVSVADYAIAQDNIDLLAVNLKSDLRVNQNSETNIEKIKGKVDKLLQASADNNIDLTKLLPEQYLSDAIFETESSGTVLGSGPTDTQQSNTEEVEYDDYTRAVTAERIANVLLGSNSLDEETKDLLIRFVKANGISENRINSIRKSYESVDDEAIAGTRGYAARISRLKGLLESSNPKTAEIKKQHSALIKMQSSIKSSVEQLDRGINEAKQEATRRNKQKLVAGKAKKITTDYKKFNPKTQANDIPYTIWVSNKNGKWVAQIDDAKKRRDIKKGYVKDIDKELRELNTRHFGKIEGFDINTGKLVVPIKESKHKKVREADLRYIDSSIKVVKEINPEVSGVTKVVLGKERHDKWNTKGEYYAANSLIVNNEDFTEDDVVLIDSIGKTKKEGNFYVPDFGQDAKKSIDSAVEAGATFLLDHSYFGDKSPLAASVITGYFTKNKGYTLLQDKGRTILVKETAENKKAVRARKAKMDKDKAKHDREEQNRKDLVILNRSLALGINHVNGEPLSPNRRKNIEKQFNNLFPVVAKERFSDDADKLRNHLANTLENEAKKEAQRILKETDPDPLDYDDKAFQAQVEEIIAKESDKDALGEELLNDWTEVLKSDLNRREKAKAIKKLVAAKGLTANSISEEIIGPRSFSKGKNDMYENVFVSAKTGEIRILPVRSPLSREQHKALMDKNDTPRGHIMNSRKHIFVGTRRVVQDSTKLVEISKTTVANSVPTEYLPFVLREATENLANHAKKTLAAVSKPELNEQTDTRENGRFLDGNLYLHNSPARGLIFNNEGKVNTEVMTAVYLSLGEMLSADKMSLTRGYKTDLEIAKMFGVQEFEITPAMRKFSRDHGSPLKTAANTMGKGTLAQLGMTKKVTEDITSSEYEALVADLGNTAILIAQSAGFLEQQTASSNELAKLYKDGEVRETDTLTHFINLKDREEKNGKYINRVPNKNVETFIEGYEAYVEDLPGIQSDRKEPSVVPFDKEALDKAKSEVRNDITNSEVPEQAQTTIDILMNTEYSFDISRVDELLAAVDAKNSNVMKLLGYVDLESEEFKKLYFRDKDVQESKNRDIEKSIQELRNFREKYPHMKAGEAKSLYFEYFYSSNDRYMLDSNTINPQVDKIHRFLVTPKAHDLTYDVSKNSNGGKLFSVDGEDQSFVVRIALVQAFGGDVDKMDAMDIIEFGDAMLAMNADQLKSAKKTMLDTGKFQVALSNKTLVSDVNGNPESEAFIEGKAAHITHSLQAFEFLERVSAIKGDTGQMNSSLSLEFDSLTSGFANKIQQFPILGLKDMHLHFARVGILVDQYLDILQKDPNFKGENEKFSPEKGHSINDVLATDFFDSYKTMAKSTIEKLQDGTKQEENLSTSVKKGSRSGNQLFEIIKPMLPGGDALNSSGAAISISGALRNMFKDPFMIFNYSASIGRIVKNLGNNVAHDIAKGIATADFNNPEQYGIKEIAEDLVKSIELVHPESEKIISTAADLQDALLNYRLASLKLKKPFNVNKTGKGQRSNNLEHLLSTTVALTYGEAVKEVFNESFEPFIKMQDSMNDAFKVAFRIFDKKRLDRLKEIQQSKPDYFLSAEDHKQVIEELWDDFPWIKGPLSEALNNKDVISVVTTSVRSPNEIETSRKKPQAMLGKGHKTMSRTVSPLVRYLEEAVSAGSVLPFHAIDGAEMSELLNEMHKSMVPATAAIHDAVIAPLNKSDIVGFNYQKGMAKINTEYVLVDKLAEMLERIEKTTKDKNFSKDFKKVGIKGFKTTEKKEFPDAVKEITKKLSEQIKLVKKERERYYGKDGLLENAYYGNLVGTPGSMYQVGMTEPNVSYRDEFAPIYSNPNISVGNIVKTSGKVAPILKKVNATVVKEMAKTLGLPTNLKKKAAIKEIAKVLESDPDKISSIADYFENRKKNLKQEDLSNKLEEMTNSLSSLVADDIIIEKPDDPLSNDSSSTENNAIMSSIINEDLNTCKTPK